LVLTAEQAHVLSAATHAIFGGVSMVSEEELVLWRLAVASPTVIGALDVYLDWLLTHDPIRGELLQKRMQNSEMSSNDRRKEKTAWLALLGLDGLQVCQNIHFDPLPRSVTIDPNRIAPLSPILDLLPSLQIELVFPKQAVEAFFQWLERAVPSVYASLAPPATAASLEALVETCGPLPETFLELYRAHDGQAGEDIDFVPYHYLLDSRQVVAASKDKRTYTESWKPEWVPFARFDCDYLCLDAKTGRVIAFFLKFPGQPVIANSFGEFLAQIQTSVETANFVVTEDGLGQDPDAELAWTAMWERECAPTKSRKKRTSRKKATPRKKTARSTRAVKRKK
jgi:cell wall assembly regulator SMI1